MYIFVPTHHIYLDVDDFALLVFVRMLVVIGNYFFFLLNSDFLIFYLSEMLVKANPIPDVS